jgi:hypothetical protein
VRFFHRRFDDQQERYRAIHRHLESSRLPEAVGFEYLPEGVLVKGRLYPILKMEWIDGVPLDQYISEHLGDRKSMLALLSRFLSLVDGLRGRQIAHGDLQHGNILVTESIVGPHLRLIDYDGMWVPALAGHRSHEVGHPNYQHPSRTPKDFGPDIDAFSVWSILLSLAGIVLKPNLWDSVRLGDEQLLFAKADYEDPAESPVFDAFEQLPSEAIADLATGFVDLTVTPVASGLAWPDTAFVATELAPAVANPTVTGGEAWWNATTDEWWKTHTPTPVFLAGTWRFERATIGIGTLATVVATLAVMTGTAGGAFLIGVTAMAALAVAAALIGTYIELPVVQQKREQAARLGSSIKALEAAQRSLRELSEAQAASTGAATRRVKALESAITTTSAEAKRRLKAEADRINAELMDAKASRDAIGSAASQERKDALQRMRSDKSDELLRSHRITASSVDGIGTVLLARLQSVGIASAADFTGIRTVTHSYYGAQSNTGAEIRLRSGGWVSVHGVGTSKAAALDSWRRTQLRAIVSRLPNALPDGEIRRIDAKYKRQLEDLDARTSAARKRAKRETERLQAEAEAAVAILRTELSDVKTDLKRQRDPYRQPIARAEREVSVRRDVVDEHRVMLGRFEHVTFLDYAGRVVGLRY